MQGYHYASSSFRSKAKDLCCPAAEPAHCCWLCGHHLCLLLCTQRCPSFLGLIYTALSAQCSSQPETAAPQVWMVVTSFLMQTPGLTAFWSCQAGDVSKIEGAISSGLPRVPGVYRSQLQLHDSGLFIWVTHCGLKQSICGMLFKAYVFVVVYHILNLH